MTDTPTTFDALQEPVRAAILSVLGNDRYCSKKRRLYTEQYLSGVGDIHDVVVAALEEQARLNPIYPLDFTSLGKYERIAIDSIVKPKDYKNPTPEEQQRRNFCTQQFLQGDNYVRDLVVATLEHLKKKEAGQLNGKTAAEATPMPR